MSTEDRHRTPPSDGFRVGELARASGLTVRTLHYYDEIGLLVPSRTASGQRAYDESAVTRLYRICQLRRLGLPLTQISQALDDPTWNLAAATRRHLGELDRRLDATARLRSRLAAVLSAVDQGHEVPIDDVITTLEEITMLDTAAQARITLLVYRDIQAGYDWLTRVFALGPGRVDHDRDGRAVHAELHAGDGVIWLHGEQPDPFRLSSPATVGSATAAVAVMVDDVDAHCRHATAAGAVVVEDPVDQPYGYRVYSAHDSEGHLWSFMTPLD